MVFTEQFLTCFMGMHQLRCRQAGVDTVSSECSTFPALPPGCLAAYQRCWWVAAAERAVRAVISRIMWAGLKCVTTQLMHLQLDH